VTESGHSLAEGVHLARLDCAQLWVRYIEMGGEGTVADLRATWWPSTRTTTTNHRFANAFNEAFLDIDQTTPSPSATCITQAPELATPGLASLESRS
jgi:hypothetical protein